MDEYDHRNPDWMKLFRMCILIARRLGIPACDEEDVTMMVLAWLLKKIADNSAIVDVESGTIKINGKCWRLRKRLSFKVREVWHRELRRRRRLTSPYFQDNDGEEVSVFDQLSDQTLPNADYIINDMFNKENSRTRLDEVIKILNTPSNITAAEKDAIVEYLCLILGGYEEDEIKDKLAERLGKTIEQIRPLLSMGLKKLRGKLREMHGQNSDVLPPDPPKSNRGRKGKKPGDTTAKGSQTKPKNEGINS